MTDRRSFLRIAIMGTASLIVAGCDRISQSDWGPKVLNKAEGLNRRVQALLSPSSAMAKEYTEADISSVFHPNGTTMPNTPAYQALMANQFRDYKLRVDGMVSRPAMLSIDDLKKIDTRTQITRHDCVEGWSAIGKWQGTLLSAVLDHVGADPQARFVVFHCFDDMDVNTPYYESVDIGEAMHPQTLLVTEMGGSPLTQYHGAPLRLHAPTKYGYKQIKRIGLIAYTDQQPDDYWTKLGYDWYAGL